MGKRSNAPTATKSASKKVKVDPAFDCIVDVINSAEDLSGHCRSMLIEMLPFSLSYPLDKRHDLQEKAVTMVEETLHAKKSSLQTRLTIETEAFDKLKASEEELLTAVKECETALAAQKDVVDGSKSSMAEITSIANASSEALAEKRAAQKAASEKMSRSREEKVSFESAFEEHFKVPFEQGPHYKDLEPFLRQLDLEASLVTALPSSCLKSKDQRGSFDDLVLQELDKAFNIKISALSSAIETDTPALAEHDSTVDAAEKQLEVNKEKQKQAASELDAALKEQQNREEALNKAKVAVDEFQPQLQTLGQQVETAKDSLAAFEKGPLATFQTYKSKSTVVEEAATLGA
jgi:chromosome segregation ATPase